MCGICGIYQLRTNRHVDAEILDQMCRVIEHRGPDGQGTHLEGPLGIGMRRLSIIDIDGGMQPIYNEDRTVAVVFNGEIYNFRQLRPWLESRGHRFTTESDTEVIVHLYEDFGDELFCHLNGMFAIAIWDTNRRKLLLGRDRLGQKPIYYTWGIDGIVFGSELKCLWQVPNLRWEINHTALYHYFTLGYIPHPFSIYERVFQLPPASYLSVTPDGITQGKYWQLTPRVKDGWKYEDAIDELRELLADATQLRMISEVPVGAFLSGGLDSSITVALMAQSSTSQIKTYHIDFDDAELSEVELARLVARRYQTDHHEMVVRPEIAKVFDSVVMAFDEPFGDASAIPTYFVSELTKKHVTVALAGDGGDEHFGGYRRYRSILDRPKFPNLARHLLGALGTAYYAATPTTAPWRRYIGTIGMDNRQLYGVGAYEIETRELLSREVLAELPGEPTWQLLQEYMDRCPSDDRLAPYSFLDTNYYLPDDILTKVDRMSMVHALEVRSPFLDFRVAELAAQMPCDWKIRGNNSKVILKECFARDLPVEVLRPRKRGFSMPLEKWLRSELRADLIEAVHAPDIHQLGLFCMPRIRSLAEEHLSGRRNRADVLWRYLFFVRWWRLCGRGRISGVVHSAQRS